MRPHDIIVRLGPEGRSAYAEVIHGSRASAREYQVIRPLVDGVVHVFLPLDFLARGFTDERACTAMEELAETLHAASLPETEAIITAVLTAFVGGTGSYIPVRTSNIGLSPGFAAFNEMRQVEPARITSGS